MFTVIFRINLGYYKKGEVINNRKKIIFHNFITIIADLVAVMALSYNDFT